MKQYLKDMKPTEVIDKLHAGNLVYYTDTKGKRFIYAMYRGVLWRLNRDTKEVDGYNRSIYSTGEAYFMSDDEGLQLQVGKIYKTSKGELIRVDRKDTEHIFNCTNLSQESPVDYDIFGECLDSFRDDDEIVKEV